MFLRYWGEGMRTFVDGGLLGVDGIMGILV